MPSAMPVKIRGTVYPSGVAAARALGVKPRTIYSAVEHGTTDNVGKGRGYCPPETRRGGKRKAIKIGPVEFESRSAADRAFGFCEGRTSSILTRARPAAMQTLIARAMQMQAEAEAEMLKAAMRQAVRAHA